MPDIQITIGGRNFEVACQKGEEHFLQAAATLLNNEASVLTEQIGRLPESRMLLMAGLMLADKTAGMEEEIRSLRERLNAQDDEIAGLKAQGGGGGLDPAALVRLNALAERAESMAGQMEDKLDPK